MAAQTRSGSTCMEAEVAVGWLLCPASSAGAELCSRGFSQTRLG